MRHVVILNDPRNGRVEAEFLTTHAVGSFTVEGECVSEALQRVVDEIEQRELRRAGVPD